MYPMSMYAAEVLVAHERISTSVCTCNVMLGDWITNPLRSKQSRYPIISACNKYVHVVVTIGCVLLSFTPALRSWTIFQFDLLKVN